MCIKVSIERFIDDAQPGWVECRLVDASGMHHVFVEKAPVVSHNHLDATSQYPCSGVIGCTVLQAQPACGGRELVDVDTTSPWGIESTAGTTRFRIYRDQLTDVPSTGSRE